MTIDQKQLARFNRDYLYLKGTAVQNFVCPITLVDDPLGELCNGHVLNKAIRRASRATVIEYRDIDNYFGQVIEPDLVQWLNIPVLTKDELFRKSSKLHVTIHNSEKIEAFYRSRKKGGDKFPQINLFGPDKTIVSSPFLKTTNPKLWEFKDAEVEGVMVLNNTAFLGSLLKSAYLAFFRLFGYGWVFSPCGDKVRRALASFYRDKPGKEQAYPYFADFHDAVSVELTNVFRGADTLRDGSFLLHYRHNPKSKETLFALTCLFRINDRTVTVTLPSSETFGFDFSLYEDYKAFLADHSMTHNVYFAQLKNGLIHREAMPRRILHGKP